MVTQTRHRDAPPKGEEEAAMLREGTHLLVEQADRHEVANRFKSKPAGQLDPAAPLLIITGYCTSCSQPVVSFDDDLSFAEWGISGLCQHCQDSVFGSDDGDAREVSTDPALFESEEAYDGPSYDGESKFDI